MIRPPCAAPPLFSCALLQGSNNPPSCAASCAAPPSSCSAGVHTVPLIHVSCSQGNRPTSCAASCAATLFSCSAGGRTVPSMVSCSRGIRPPCAAPPLFSCSARGITVPSAYPPCWDNRLLSPRVEGDCLSPPCAEDDALLSSCTEEEEDAPPSAHATKRVLSPHAEEDTSSACAPCGLFAPCAEEDTPPSAHAPPRGLLSPTTEEDMPPTVCPTPLRSNWGDAPLSHDRSLGNKGLLGKVSLVLLWLDRIGHNNTPFPALALSCCRSCCCLLRSLACQPLFFLFHQPIDFFLAANLALVI